MGEEHLANRIRNAHIVDLYRGGKSLGEIGQEMGLTKQAVFYILVNRQEPRRRPGPTAPKERDEAIIQRYMRGATLTVVAKKFGMTPSGIWRILDRHNIERRPRGGAGHVVNRKHVRVFLEE